MTGIEDMCWRRIPFLFSLRLLWLWRSESLLLKLVLYDASLEGYMKEGIGGVEHGQKREGRKGGVFDILIKR